MLYSITLWAVESSGKNVLCVLKIFILIINISISIYFVQNQVGLHSQKTNEQDNQAHNMLSQLPAVTDRKVKQQTRPNYKLEF